jgi:hypothetical protein
MPAQVRPTGQYSVMSIPSRQAPPSPAGRPLYKRIGRQLWRHTPPLPTTELMREVESFAALERHILARFDGLGSRYLAHNDAYSENLILRPNDRRVVIVDWTGARLSAPGASLHPMALWPKSVRDDAAARYVDWMSRFGHKLALADVLFSATGTMMYRLLAFALPKRDVRQVRQALALAERLKSDA